MAKTGSGREMYHYEWVSRIPCRASDNRHIDQMTKKTYWKNMK